MLNELLLPMTYTLIEQKWTVMSWRRNIFMVGIFHNKVWKASRELKQVPKHKIVIVPYMRHSGGKSRYCFNKFTANSH
jgi:hypothetical protein